MTQGVVTPNMVRPSDGFSLAGATPAFAIPTMLEAALRSTMRLIRFRAGEIDDGGHHDDVS